MVGIRYIALNRIISVISKNHNVWYLLLFTKSKIEQLLPPDSTTPTNEANLHRDHHGSGKFPVLNDFLHLPSLR
jgi:hypothetical protein